MLLFALRRDKDACASLAPFMAGGVATVTVNCGLAEEVSTAEGTEVSVSVRLDVPAEDVDHGSGLSVL